MLWRVTPFIILQAVAFLGPALFLGLAMKLGGGGVENETLTVGKTLACKLGLLLIGTADKSSPNS